MEWNILFTKFAGKEVFPLIYKMLKKFLKIICNHTLILILNMNKHLNLFGRGDSLKFDGYMKNSNFLIHSDRLVEK